MTETGFIAYVYVAHWEWNGKGGVKKNGLDAIVEMGMGLLVGQLFRMGL
jgi:hypothetical protein